MYIYISFIDKVQNLQCVKHDHSKNKNLNRQKDSHGQYLFLCIVHSFRSVMKDYLKRHEDKELGRTTGPQPSINPFRDRTEGDTPGSFGMVLPGGDSGRSSGQMILVMLLRLRQCCCHLSLMKEVRIGIGLDLIKLHFTLKKRNPLIVFIFYLEFLWNFYVTIMA